MMWTVMRLEQKAQHRVCSDYKGDRGMDCLLGRIRRDVLCSIPDIMSLYLMSHLIHMENCLYLCHPLILHWFKNIK